MANEIESVAFLEFKKRMNFSSLGEDVILVDDISKIHFSDKPEVQKYGITIVVISGKLDIAIDLKRYSIETPSLLVIMAGQITQCFHASDDLQVLISVTSSQFREQLEIDLQKTIPIFLKIKNNPLFSLTSNDLEILRDNYNLMNKIIKQEGSTFRFEILKHMSHAFFYFMIDIFLRNEEANNNKMTKQELIFDSFYKYVQIYYKQERGLVFYADKMCFTPKYLSSVIKSTSGKSANEWIDSHVVLEAKALLKSTNMTIQQISDELNFPSQSFFGKFFKRYAGMSPKEYRKV